MQSLNNKILQQLEVVISFHAQTLKECQKLKEELEGVSTPSSKKRKVIITEEQIALAIARKNRKRNLASL